MFSDAGGKVFAGFTNITGAKACARNIGDSEQCAHPQNCVLRGLAKSHQAISSIEFLDSFIMCVGYLCCKI